MGQMGDTWPQTGLNRPIFLIIPRCSAKEGQLYVIEKEQITVKCNNKYFIWLNQLTFSVGLVLLSADQRAS
jgi:hypothetical protein